MEELAIELAKVLNITVESAIELMPVIRDQYMYYRVLGLVSNVSFLSLAIFVISGFIAIGEEDNFLFRNPDYTKDEYRKNSKIVWFIALVSFIMMISTSILRYIVATDYMILREFL